MVLSLAPSVFAAEEPRITVAVDKTSVKAGETVTFTYESTAAVTEMTNLEVWLAYDGDAFEYVSMDTEGSVWFENPTVRSRYTLFGYPIFRLSEEKDDEEDVDAGKMFSVTFRALETITDVKEASFYNHDSLTVWEYEWEEHKAADGYFDHSKNDPIYVTVTPKGTEPIATPTGYSVSMGADQTVAADQKVLIPVTVNSSRATVTGFNAYDMTFTYDPAALTLNTASDAAANLTVEDGGGTVRVRRYGETAPLGEALTLDFTAKTGATSTVTLTEAKFDLDANSINFDAPAATISDGDTTVTGLWNVTLPEGFRSAGGVDTVENGGDFTFTAPDAHYDYTLNVTTNGKTEEVTMNLDVYLYSDSWEQLDMLKDAGSGKATFTFTVPKDEGTYYIVGFDPNRKIPTDDSGGTNYAKIAPATAILTVSGTAELERPFQTISVDGKALDGKNISYEGIVSLGSEDNEEFKNVYEDVPKYHVIVPEGTKTVDITYGKDVDIYHADATAYGYETDLAADAVSSATIRSVTLESSYKANDDGTQTVTTPVARYVRNADGKSMAVTLESGSGKNFRPVALFTFEYAQAEPDPEPEVKYGDVNGDGTIDVSDALLICQIYLANVTPTDAQKAAADVNGDGTTDVSDALMVCQYYLGNITGFPAGKTK